MTTPDFTTWLRQQGHCGRTWVLARRTPRMVERYGEDCTFFSPKQFEQLTEKHRVLVRDTQIAEIADAYGLKLHATSTKTTDALIHAFEAGRKAR